jgi:hypothetical protein
MRQIWLFINGQAVDLPASTKGLVKFSQASAALSDVAARVGEFSFPFTLPPTRRNAQVFGVDKLHPLALNKFGYYTDYAYELRAGGQLFNGTFRLTSLKNGYTGTLLGEGLSWAVLLGDSKLTDLEFAPIDYDGTQLEYILTQDCDATDVQFPLVAFGNFFSPPTTRTLPDGSTEEVPSPPGALLDYPLSVDDYPPGVYYGNVLRQIFRGIGWQLQSRELDSDFWRSVVHTCAGADLENAWPWGRLLRAAATGSGFSQHAYVDYNGDTSDTAVGRLEGADAGNLGGLDMAGDIFFLPVPVPVIGSAPTRALDGVSSAYTAPRNGTYAFSWAASVASAQQQLLTNDAKYVNAAVLACIQRVALAVVVRRGGQFSDAGLLAGAPATQDLAGFQYLHSNYTVNPGNYAGSGSVYLEAGDVAQLCVVARSRLTDTPTGKDAITREMLELNFGVCSLACTGYVDDNGESKTQLQPAAFLPPLAQRQVVLDFLRRTDSYVVADASRRVATILSRAELSTASGAAIDLSALCDVRSVEYLPALGAGVGSFVFSPAENGEESLAVASDVVAAVIGAGDGSQSIGSLYAPVAFRTVYSSSGQRSLPTCSTKDILAQNRSEVQWEVAGEIPRLIRFVGPDASLPVPFMQRFIGLGRAAWDGVLCWDGTAGAVASYYQPAIKTALNGHLARVQLPLSPELYKSLAPGRKVTLNGASYTTEVINNWDATSEDSLTQLDLRRQVL